GQRGARAGDVVHARIAVLQQPDHELRQVAHVDELYGIRLASRYEDLAAALDAHGPVGEAVAVVARPDDEVRPHDVRAAAERVDRGAFRLRLLHTVARPLRARRVLEAGLHALVDARLEVRQEHAGRRDEHV